MMIRAITPDDLGALADFFASVPEGDRMFFKENVLDEDVVKAWGEVQPRHERLIAVDDDGVIAAWLALTGGVGWSAHVGDLRLVVAPSHRRRGLGRQLAQQATINGLRQGYTKLVVEMVADDAGAQRMFGDLGFRVEALLVDHVRDRAGRLQDLVLLAHHASEIESELVLVGIMEELIS